MPDQSFRYAVAPVFACPTDTSEHSSERNPGDSDPLVNRYFHSIGHRHGSYVPAFTDQINDGPMFLALLQMPEVKIGQLAASESAAKQDG